MGPRFNIGGIRVVGTHLATGPDDEGAIAVKWGQKPETTAVKLVSTRDIAIFRLEHPLARSNNRMHGIPFFSGQLQEGESVTLYAYPGGGQLTAFSGTFVREVNDGLLEFKVPESKTGIAVQPGISGGLIVNHLNQAVGLACCFGDSVIQAVPIWSLADFVKKVYPDTYAKLFLNDIYRPGSPVTVDVEAKPDFVANEVLVSHEGASPKSILPQSYLHYKSVTAAAFPPRSGVLERRKEEPISIQLLRNRAQKMVDDMANFTAIQTLKFGGGQRAVETVSQNEVRVAYGHQTFRKWPDGKKERSQLPYPTSDRSVVIGGEWSALPNMVGRDLKLRIEEVGEQEMNGHLIKVFQYQASVEDDVCQFRSTTDFFFYRHDWVGAVECHGEVWTDEKSNIVRISLDQQLPPSKTKWQNLHIVVIYGWLEAAGREPRILPTNISLEANFRNDHNTYWCRGSFSNYRMFTSDVKLMFAQ